MKRAGISGPTVTPRDHRSTPTSPYETRAVCSRSPTRRRTSTPPHGVVCSARDGNLPLAIHFYDHEDDIEQITRTLAEL